MIYNDCHIQDEALDDNFYIGKYGEDLLFSKHPDGSYLFSSFVLNLFDLVVPEITKTKIINAYCRRGNADFDKESIKIHDRLYYLGRVLKGLYDLRNNYDDLDENRQLINLIIIGLLLDVETFKLRKSEYIDFFLTFGSSEDWDYINYMLEMRKLALSLKIYHWKAKTHLVHNGLEISGIHAYASTKKEAIKQILEDNPDATIKSIKRKELITDGRFLYQLGKQTKEERYFNWIDKL